MVLVSLKAFETLGPFHRADDFGVVLEAIDIVLCTATNVGMKAFSPVAKHVDRVLEPELRTKREVKC